MSNLNDAFINDFGAEFSHMENPYSTAKPETPMREDVKAFQHAMEAQPDKTPMSVLNASKEKTSQGKTLPKTNELFAGREQPATKHSSTEGLKDHRTQAQSYHADDRLDLETGGLAKDNDGSQKQDATQKAPDFIDAMFRGMTPAELQNAQGASLQGAEATQSAALVDAEALEALVSRILVNTPDRGGSEVRLTLADPMLQGTEVSVMRGIDGALTVRITATDASAFQTLVASRAQLLESLQSHEKQDVTVVMEEGDQQEGNEGDARQRSRGLDAFES